MLSTGFLEDMYQKLYVVRLMIRVLPKMMIKRFTYSYEPDSETDD